MPEFNPINERVKKQYEDALLHGNTATVLGAYLSENDDWNQRISEIYLKEIEGKSQGDVNWEMLVNETTRNLAAPFAHRYGAKNSVFIFVTTGWKSG